MTPKELELTLPHLTLAALAWGDPVSPPLLALHGWLDNAASFATLAPRLAKHFYVVAVDLPGHGRSQHRPAGTWYHYLDYGDEVQAAAAALGWKRFTLLGHSLGGAVACVFAAVYPAQVERLILIESLGPLTAAPEQALDHLRRGFGQREVFHNKSLRVFATVKEAVEARVAATGLSAEAARLVVERGVRYVDRGWSWSSDPRLTVASPLRFVEAQIQTMLSGIEAPSLVVFGETETSYLPRALMDARAACMRDLRVLRLPGQHHLHLEDPAPVAQAMLEFCRGS